MEVILLPVSAIILTSFERIVLILVFMEVILLQLGEKIERVLTGMF